MIQTNHIHSKKGHGNGLWPFFFFILVGMLTACQRPSTLPLTDADYEPTDSTSHIVLTDTMSLYRPFVVDTLMHVSHIPSQMDADTALLGTTAIAGTTTRSRMALYQKQHQAKDWEVLCPVEEEWSLVVCGQLKARTVKALKGRTIAAPREDASRQILLSLMQKAGVPTERIYFAQINSMALRADMLTNDQVDAAMLTAPYTQRAVARGHRIVKTLVDTTQTILVVRSSATADQRDEILRMYKTSL